MVVRFKIAEGSHEYNCVRNPLLRAGFRRTRGGTWNFRWGPHLSEADYQAMNPYQASPLPPPPPPHTHTHTHFESVACPAEQLARARVHVRGQRRYIDAPRSTPVGSSANTRQNCSYESLPVRSLS